MTTFTAETPSLSDGTKADYLHRYHQLHRRFSKESGRTDMTPDEIVANLILLKPTYTQDSWRKLKNSVLYAIGILSPACEQAIEALRAESSSPLARSSSNTSGRKKKHVTDEDWRVLQSGLRKRAKEGHRHSDGLLNFLTATLACGLRPAEWCYSSISRHHETGRDILRVKNAKHSNGRGNGEYRELFIDGLTESERKAVEAALLYCAAKNDEEAEKIQTALRNEISIVRSMAIVTSKRPQSSVTLYSFRHQFIADAKLTFDDPTLISALVGHSSTKTAFEHYGKRRFGTTNVRVYPTPESVEAVQKITLETYKAFVAERGTNRPSL